MKIFDINGNMIEDPDLNLGYLVHSQRPIVHRYHVTQEEVGHYEVIKEYPNGGKDVEWIVDIQEEGSWITYDKDNNEIETDLTIPDDAPHEIDIDDTETILIYVLYTEEELAEMTKEPEPTVEDMFNAMLGGLGYE